MINKQDILDSLDIREFYSTELSSYKFKPNGSSKAMSLCPFHEDTNPSLSVNLDTGAFKCFGCDIKGSIFDFYMKKHNVDFQLAIQSLSKEAGLNTGIQRRIVNTYDYVDENSNLMFQALRYEPKDFRQRRPDGKGKWIYNLKDVRLVPYNLPEIIKADSIIICEGEKDCDNLKSLGLTATTCPMGAGKWRNAYNQYLKSKEIAIIPDNDTPGQTHAEQIAKNLRGTAQSIKIVKLPDLKEKEDVSDWILEGGTKTVLVELIKQSPEWTEDIGHFVTVEDIFKQNAEPVKWCISEILPESCISLLTAPPSSFKTWLALDIARCVSEGVQFLGRDTQARKVYYIDKENPCNVMKERLQKLGIHHHKQLLFWPSWSKKESPYLKDDSCYLDLTKERPLIIFDSLIRFYPKGVDENKSTDISPVMECLRKLSTAGATVLVLHHAGKNDSSGYRGSSDILGGVDIAYTVKPQEATSTLILKCIKSRYQLEKDIPIEIESDETMFRFEDASQKIAHAKEQDEKEKMEGIRECIKEFEEQEQKNPSQTNLIKLTKDILDISKNSTLKYLAKGEGKYWITETEGAGRPIYYKNIDTTFPPFQYIYSSGKPERSEDSENNNKTCIGADKCNNQYYDSKFNQDTRKLNKWCKRTKEFCEVN